MLMGWYAEPDPDGQLGPGDRLRLQEFLNAVLP
jgi:hypothetical protein